MKEKREYVILGVGLLIFASAGFGFFSLLKNKNRPNTISEAPLQHIVEKSETKTIHESQTGDSKLKKDRLKAALMAAILARLNNSKVDDADNSDTNDDINALLEEMPEIDQSEKELMVQKLAGELKWKIGGDVFRDILKEQAADHVWTNNVINEANELLENEAYAGTHLESVDCRENICMMILSHDDAAANDLFEASDFPEKGSWLTEQFGERYEVNGHPGKRIFFTPKGVTDSFKKFNQRIVSISKEQVVSSLGSDAPEANME